MESRVLELIICKLMTSFHDKSKPSNGGTDLQNGGAPKEPYWDSTATMHYFGILRHLILDNGTGSIYIYDFDRVFLDKKQSRIALWECC